MSGWHEMEWESVFVTTEQCKDMHKYLLFTEGGLRHDLMVSGTKNVLKEPFYFLFLCCVY